MKKHKIKLVISDIDDTLLPLKADYQSFPSKKVIDTIKMLNKQNILLCLATGRIFKNVQELIEVFNLKTLLILEGGSKIYNPLTKKYIWEKHLEKESAKLILNYLSHHAFEFHFSEEDMIKINIKDIKSWTINKISIYKVTKDRLQKLITFLRKISNIHYSVMKTWRTDGDYVFVSITDIQATKQYAVFEVLKFLKIKSSEVLGIGDDSNDIPLLSACNVKVAMGNADPKLKEIADWVTPPVWEDGFTKAMEKFVL